MYTNNISFPEEMDAVYEGIDSIYNWSSDFDGHCIIFLFIIINF